jgi:hypothetical protein
VPDELDALAGQLTERLARLGGALVTFSGGVVSSLAAALAARALGEQALAVTAVSPALASGDLDGARSAARAVDVRYELISRPSWSVAAETDTRPPRMPLVKPIVAVGGHRVLRTADGFRRRKFPAGCIRSFRAPEGPSHWRPHRT